MRYVAIVGIVALGACASNSGVISLGNDRYIISKQAATGFPGVGAIRTEALQEASVECEKSQKAVEIESQTESEPPYVLGNFPRVEITFRCVASEGNRASNE